MVADLLRIITSTVDKLCAGTNIDDLERPWNRKIAVFSKFFAILGCNAHFKTEFSLKFSKITGDRPSQPAYETKLMLSRVS